MAQIINVPDSGRHVVRVESGQNLRFTADLSSASFERPEADAEGNKSPDLLVTFDSGSVLLLEGFFLTVAEGEDALPVLELADGTTIAGEQFLAAMNPDLDLSTAAGPSTVQSSGLNDMADLPDLAAGGVDRMGSLGTDQFSNARAGGNIEYTTLSPLGTGDDMFAQAPAAPPAAITPPDPDPVKPDPDPDPTDPATSFFVRTALLESDGAKDPTVFMHMDRLLENGSAGSPTVAFAAPPDSKYNAVYDENTGNIVISLKDPSAGPQPVENITVTVTGPDGEVKSFVIQAGSSDGTDASAISWPSATADESAGLGDLSNDRQIWVGEHERHIEGGATVTTPSVPDSGSAIHYQLTDSHLKAESGESNSVELNLGGTDKDGKATDGSFLLANSTDGSGRGLVETEHSDPLINKEGARLTPYDYYDNARYGGQDYGDKADYRASVFAGMTAQGQARYKDGAQETFWGYTDTGQWGKLTNEIRILDEFTPAENRVTVKGGSAEIRVEADTPVFDGNDHAVVSGTWAEKGGLNAVTASGDLSVNVSSGGITGGGEKSATVSGVRSHGAVMSTDVDNGYYRVPEADRNLDHENTASNEQYRVAHASRTELSSEEGDVNVGVTMTGNAAEQDHSRVSYAAVAATERGQVDIKAAEDVNIAVGNEVEGPVEAGGAYGIYSGYGLGADDMARRSDFSKHEQGEYGKISEDDNDYRAYMDALASDYARDNAYLKYYLKDENGDYIRDENGNEIKGSEKVKEDASRVTIEAEKDLNVDVNLGSQGYKGEAAAVKTLFGDVDIKAGGDVNLGLRSAGNTEGAVSGVHFAGGELNIAAWGNVNIDAKANGSDVAALRVQPQGATENPDYGHIGEAGLKPPASVNIEGENIRLTAEAGADGTSRDNAATGIDTRGAVGAENLELRFSAEQDISISATAHARGGETSATGIAHDASIYSSYNKQGGPLDMTFDAQKVDVSAKIEGGSGTATGISNTGGRLVIHGEGEIYGGPYQQNIFDEQMKPAIDNLTITAEGGNRNVGVIVGERSASEDDHNNKQARTDIHAKELEINAKGGDGSESYGAVADSPYSKYGKMAELNINADRLVINAEGEKAVGLSADGEHSRINITNATNSYAREEYWNGRHYEEDLTENPNYSGLQVVINAKVTDQSQLAGIALEALNGGYVRIISDSSRNEYNWDDEEGATPVPGDSISLNGDIRVGNTFTSTEEDYYYHDYSVVEIETGHGDDLISIKGDVHVGAGELYLKTGGGNDTVLINGTMNIGLSDSGLGNEGYVEMAFAKGNNALHIEGDVNLGGDSALSIYSDAYDESQAMTMVVDGAVNLGANAQMYVDTGIGSDTVVLGGGVNFVTDDKHYHEGLDSWGDEMVVSTADGHDQVEVGGVRFRDIDSPDSPYSKGRFSIDTGSGNDMLIMSGKVEYGNTFEGGKHYDAFNATMGEGHDMLVLTAESYEQFMDYYSEWLDAKEAGGLKTLGCNGIIVTGATGEDGQKFIDWLQEQAGDLKIEIQNYGDANMSFVNDAANLSGDFAFDGSQGDNDGLYVRFNDGHGNEGDQGAKALANLTEAFKSGDIKGLEFLVLDMANGEEQELDFGQFSSFLDMVRSQSDNTTQVILRADESDNLNLKGWTQGASESFGGVEYSVYYNDDSEADKLYVQVVTGIGG